MTNNRLSIFVMPDVGFPQEPRVVARGKLRDWSWKSCDVASSAKKKDWMPAFAGMTNAMASAKKLML